MVRTIMDGRLELALGTGVRFQTNGVQKDMCKGPWVCFDNGHGSQLKTKVPSRWWHYTESGWRLNETVSGWRLNETLEPFSEGETPGVQGEEFYSLDLFTEGKYFIIVHIVIFVRLLLVYTYVKLFVPKKKKKMIIVYVDCFYHEIKNSKKGTCHHRV